MIIILSAAKNLDFKSKPPISEYTPSLFPAKTKKLIKELRKFSKEEIRNLMNINPKLAELNFVRFLQWSAEYTPKNSKQAILAFNGEVYNGLKAIELDIDSLFYAQDHLRILSGLFGILRPLDLIQPYPLEMSTSLEFGKYSNLYKFWGNLILKHLNELSESGNKVLINLASNEYARAAKLKGFKGRVITPVFKQIKGDEYKTIVVYLKKARGLMTRFILEKRIEDPEQLKLFETDGYFFSDTLSTGDEWVFTR